MDKEDKKLRIEQVNMIRKMVESGLFSDIEITESCKRFGLNDTAFRDKTQKEKLDDFLLDTNYYKK